MNPVPLINLVKGLGRPHQIVSLYNLRPHHIPLPQRLPLSILALQQHRSALQAFQTVPLHRRHVQHIASRHHIHRLHQCTRLIIQIHLEMPRTHTTVSDDVLCLWIGITVPGAMAFSILCNISSAEFLKPRFILSLGDAFACSVNLSSIS